jgi:hypothetical protein
MNPSRLLIARLSANLASLQRDFGTKRNQRAVNLRAALRRKGVPLCGNADCTSTTMKVCSAASLTVVLLAFLPQLPDDRAAEPQIERRGNG